MAIPFIDEGTAHSLMGDAEAFSAVEEVFAEMARGQARNFPVVREAIGHADALFGFKSGIDKGSMTLGLKAGGYWPHNTDRGLTNHQSTVFLFDPDTGQVSAVVSGNYLTAVRTGAACAVAIRYLSREDSKVLGIVGAGHQATFQLRAAARQRKFERVVAWNIVPQGLDKLGEVARELGLGFASVEREELCAQADVIITITPSTEPMLEADWIRPGTHLSCMGADTVGKQEVDAQLFAKALAFTDEPAQSALLGECQHAVKAGILHLADIVPIGRVIAGEHAGRSSASEITVFDGTGVGLQDLAVASRVVKLAAAR